MGMDIEGTAMVNQASLQRQASLSLTSALSKKTVDEVWRDIQQSKDNEEKRSLRTTTYFGRDDFGGFLGQKQELLLKHQTKNAGGPLVGVDPKCRIAVSTRPIQNELENKVSRLEEENERLKEAKGLRACFQAERNNLMDCYLVPRKDWTHSFVPILELEKVLPSAPPPEPKYQLSRTTSAPF
ncbi:hypothetical protein J5N97_000471 [Dioscorea zingiberensis]|uniref:Uncharacterized protein n=1 Tax=Dioscorea zingiberensis TaxID=325984 RepID=A0A9D5H1C7_9LILI|nr:hypothetical protein J5N97_000471 [Dioscorea zingiberensis]